MRPFCLVLLSLFIGTVAPAQRVSAEDVSPYEYPTKLKGGYRISFKVEGADECLYLKKGGKRITELSGMGRGTLYKSLGYVGADFTDYFVLVHSFGSANPHYIELIKKTNGKNVIRGSSAWIGADDKKEFLLYCENDVPDSTDKMILLDVRRGKKQRFNFPKDIFDGPQVLRRIELIRISSKQLVIKYDTQKGEKTKTYNR